VTAPVFLCERERLDGAELTLEGPEGRHAAAVRRLRPGERVDLTDGAGAVAECVVRETLKDKLRLDVLRRYDVERPALRLTVVQGLPKGDRGELAVEMMTEAGVDVIVPWAAARSITQWKGDKVAKGVERWRAVVREAAKQAIRPSIPEVEAPLMTKDLARSLGERREMKGLALVLEPTAQRPISAVLAPDSLVGVGTITLVVGPEGGIAPEELRELELANAELVRLGPEVLRTSTAGPAALAAIQALLARW